MWIYLIYSLLCVPHFWYLCCIYDVSEISSRNLFIKTLWWSCFHLQYNIQKHYSWEQNNYIRNLNYVQVPYTVIKRSVKITFNNTAICCSMPYRTSVICRLILLFSIFSISMRSLLYVYVTRILFEGTL